LAKKTPGVTAPPRAAKAVVRPGTSNTEGSGGARQVRTNAERRAMTRRAVLDAAAECFDQAGYLATRLDDVTTRAKLTKGAVYFHFGSKEALAEAVIQEQASYWPAVLDELAGRPGTPLDHLIDLTYEVARSLRDNVSLRAGVRLSLDQDVPGVDPAQTLSRWTDTVGDLLRRARRAGALADHVVPAAAARFIVAAFLGAYHLATVVDGKPDARKRLDEFWSLALPQLRA
jgi:AcrR family transcriptional regulator